MMDREKQAVSYEAPHLEVIEVEVEKGFATSGGFEPMDDEDL